MKSEKPGRKKERERERKKERLVGWFLGFKVLDQLHHTTDVNSKTLKQESPLPAQHVVFF